MTDRPTTSQTSASGTQSSSGSGRTLNPDEACVIKNARSRKSVDEIQAACHLERWRVLQILQEHELPVIESAEPVVKVIQNPTDKVSQVPDERSPEEICIAAEGKKGRSVRQIMRKCGTTKQQTLQVLRDKGIPITHEHDDIQ